MYDPRDVWKIDKREKILRKKNYRVMGTNEKINVKKRRTRKENASISFPKIHNISSYRNTRETLIPFVSQAMKVTIIKSLVINDSSKQNND